MRSSVAFTVACASLARVALGQSSTTVVLAVSAPTPTTAPYTNPFTSFLPLTDSLGVVTGQPSLVTTQPVLESTPAGASSALTVTFASAPTDSAAAVGAGASSGFSTVTGSGSNDTVLSATPTGTESAAASGGSRASGSASGSAAASSSRAAAPFMEPAVGLGFAGALVAALL